MTLDCFSHQERLEKERIEREAATEELKRAMESAKETRSFDGLAKPIKRCLKAVDVDAALIEAAEALTNELIEEKRARELAEKLERERVEREAAAEELSNAMNAAKESRDAGTLTKPIKRAKKAVDFPEATIGAAEAFKLELEAEAEAARLKAIEDARLAKEKEEREAAGDELAKAVEAAKAARAGAPPSPEEGGSAAMAAAAKMLEKPIKRAKKAVDFPPESLAAAEELKSALEDEQLKRKEAERLERERIEREAASAEVRAEISASTASREPAALIKALKRARKAVGVDEALLGEGDSLVKTCEEERRAAEQAAKDAAKAAKEEAAAAALAAKEAAKAAVNVKQMLPLSVIVHADAGPNHTAQLPEEYRHEVRFSWSMEVSNVSNPRSVLKEKLVLPILKEYYRQDKSTSSRIPVDRILLFVNGAPVPYDNEHFRAGEFQRAFGAVLGAAEVESRVLMTSDDL